MTTRNGNVGSRPQTGQPTRSRASIAPSGTLIALEPRLMFDGVGLSGFDASRPLAEPHADAAAAVERSLAASTEPRPLDTRARDSARPIELVVIDGSVPDIGRLLDALRDDLDVLVLDPAGDGLAQLAAAVADRDGTLSAIHLVSHGALGQIALGNRTLDAAALDSHRAALATIGEALTAQGDLLLYGCDVGDGRQGMQFLQALAAATSADVAASVGPTGSEALGGNWALEAAVGRVDAVSVVMPTATDAWAHLLAGAPAVALSVDRTDVLVGEGFRLTATFDNLGPDVGYGPYLDLFVPANGADGGGSPDGLTITGATYGGQALNVTQITLTAGDLALGTVAHPYARDTVGNDRVAIPTGYAAGDRLVVIELPFGGFTPGQPAVAVSIDARVSSLADVGSALSVTARAGFRLGNDALDNAATDPTLQSATTALSVTPALYRLTTSYVGPEHETASGPNYARAYRIDVDVADGQTLSAIELAAALDPGMQFSAITGTPGAVGGTSLGAAPAGGWTNVNGVLVSTAASGVSAPGTPGGTVARTFASVTGTTAVTDLSMVVGFHIPEQDASNAPVLDPVSGGAVTLSLGTSIAAQWAPLDVRDAAGPVGATDADAHELEVQAIALQKTESVAFEATAGGLSPVDELRYTLDVQVSDFFAFGDRPGGAGTPAAAPLQVVDTLSDGLEMVDGSTGPFDDPVLTVVRSGAPAETYSLTRGVHYTVATLGDGRQQVVFDLASALPAGAGQVLVGDLFAGDATRTGATTASLSFSARVLGAYRVAPPDANGDPVAGATQLALNEGDRVVNRAIIGGTILGVALDPLGAGLAGQSDDARTSSRIGGNEVTIVVWGRNGQNVGNDPANPTRVAPGDTVSYVMEYVVPTGDFENFDLTAFLPLPLFSATDPDADGTPNPFTQMAGHYYAKPPVGQFSFEVVGGDGTGAPVPTVTALADANGLRFDFGDRSDASDLPVTIRVAFTVRTGDAPFDDAVVLTAQAQSTVSNTANDTRTSQSIVQVRTSEPELTLRKGIVNDDIDYPTSVFDPTYTTNDPRALIQPAGNPSGDPRLALIDDAAVAVLDADVTGVDGGDTLRYAIVVQNLSQSYRGAFDVTVRDALPDCIDPGSVSQLRIALGDGTLIYDGTVGSLANLVRGDGAAITSEADAIAALFGAQGLQLVDDVGGDGVAGTADDRGAIGGTRNAFGGAAAAGANVLVITYDARLRTTVEAGEVCAASATLTRYAASEGGSDFTPIDLTDAASFTVTLPLVDKLITATSEPPATTVDNDVVVGERITYQVTLTVPEGTTSGAQFVDTLAPGLSFVSIDAITASGGLSFSGGLPVPGSVVPTAAGGDANRITIPFGTITNADTDNATAERITVTYTVVVANVAGNQQGVSQGNDARFTSSTIAVGDAAPDVTVVEPSLTVALTPSTTRVDAGDVVTFDLTITAAAGRPPAFDVTLDVANLVPAGLSYVGGSLTQTAGPAAASLAFGGAGVIGSWTTLAAGSTVTLQYQARVSDTAALGTTFDQNAMVRFSSLPGAANADLSPLATVGDFERTGDSADPGAALNDYRVTDNAPLSMTVQVPVLTLVRTSEPSSEGTTVVPGEVLRYRMVVQVPEGTAPGAEICPTLPAGLRFVNDGSATIAFVANGGGGGIDSSTFSGGPLDLVGGGADAAAIAGLVPTRVVPGSAIRDGTGAMVPGGTVMAAGDSPCFALGDLTNSDRDDDREFVVIEFNAIVDNAAGNVSGTALSAVFDWESGGAVQAVSNTVQVTVGEPSIIDLDKRVVDVNGTQVTFEVVFTNTGNEEAHDVRVVDAFAGASNLSFNGAGSVTGVPAGATNVSDADTFQVLIPTLAPGESVSIRYVGTVGDLVQPVPARDAVVTYTSLTPAATSLTVSTSAGDVTTTTTGERTGNTADYGASANTYQDSDSIGFGKIRGTLWDDTNVPDDAIGAGEARLDDVQVTLTHAGADGVFGTADDMTRTERTDATGYYGFGAVPAGPVRITVDTVIPAANGGALGEVRSRFDVEGARTDGTIALTVLSGTVHGQRDFAFVQVNDPPTVTVPGAQTIAEDIRQAIPGVSVADPDAGTAGDLRVVLTVTEGSLDLTVPPGVSATGNGTATVTLVGSIADLNQALATLGYTGGPDYFGADTLTVRVDDRGNTGDADDDRLPGETVDDNLFALATVPITVTNVDDTLDARPDVRSIGEDDPPISGNAVTGAGVSGGQPGDVADVDLDGDPITVVGVARGTVPGPISAGVGSAVAGTYGTLTLGSSGAYTYATSPAAQGLQVGQTVQDVFSYTITDGNGNLSTATITITVTGTNDPPVAVADANRVRLDQPTGTGGNVVGGGAPTDAPDSDPDVGDRLTVVGVSAGTASGPVSGGVGSTVTGQYGTVTIAPNGAYSYVPDGSDPRLTALRPGQTVVDTFTYTITDGNGGSSTTTLTITLEGVDEPPAAAPDTNRLRADSTVPAAGNTVNGGSAGDRPDLDPDGDALTVVGVRAGADPATAAGAGVGTAIPGRYGSVVLQPDGSYAYVVDRTNPAVLALRPGETLTDPFTYTVADPGGQRATTTLTITIDGVNDPPTAGRIVQTIDPGNAPTPVLPPSVNDPDDPAPTLTVRIDTVGRPEAGTFLRPDGTAVVPGQALTVDQLQSLRYQPAPGFAGTPQADGTIPAGTVGFTVVDPGGASGPGSITINLRPTPGPGAAPPPGPQASSSTFFDLPGAAPPPAGAGPVADTLRAVGGAAATAGGVGSSGGQMLRPYELGPLAAPPALDVPEGSYVGQAVADARNAMLGDRERLTSTDALDLDAGGLFPSNRATGLFGDERIGPTRDWNPLAPPPAPQRAEAAAVAPAVAAAPLPGARAVAPDEDCAPEPKPKPKPIKRVLPDAMKRPAATFSEQLDEQKKKFRPPQKIAPKPPPSRQC